MFIHQNNNKINKVFESQQYNSPYLSQLLNITVQYKSDVQFFSFVP